MVLPDGGNALAVRCFQVTWFYDLLASFEESEYVYRHLVRFVFDYNT